MEKPTVKCPFAGFKRCMGHGCALYVQIRGHDMNTGKEVDQWACAHSLLPMLLIENSGMQRQTGAAVESLRNENVKAAQMTVAAIVAAATGKLEGQGNHARIDHQG